MDDCPPDFVRQSGVWLLVWEGVKNGDIVPPRTMNQVTRDLSSAPLLSSEYATYLGTAGPGGHNRIAGQQLLLGFQARSAKLAGHDLQLRRRALALVQHDVLHEREIRAGLDHGLVLKRKEKEEEKNKRCRETIIIHQSFGGFIAWLVEEMQKCFSNLDVVFYTLNRNGGSERKSEQWEIKIVFNCFEIRENRLN